MKLYKLTDKDNRTRVGYDNETLWGEGVTHRAVAKGYELCTRQLIHAYRTPELAVVMNQVHANITEPVLWEAKTPCKKIIDDGIKIGVKSLTTIRRVPLPEISLSAKVRFSIYCAMEVCEDKAWRKWARNWLSGKDRTARAAEAAARATVWLASAAEGTEAVEAAARAVDAAARATVWLASAAEGTEAAEGAEAVEATAWAASTAVWAAEATTIKLDLQKLILKALQDEGRYKNGT